MPVAYFEAMWIVVRPRYMYREHAVRPNFPRHSGAAGTVSFHEKNDGDDSNSRDYLSLIEAITTDKPLPKMRLLGILSQSEYSNYEGSYCGRFTKTQDDAYKWLITQDP
ncbi:hypothetical protein KPH14_005140 [Odynerus spinipes]|uniref:Uncharacterized protein n=1 Tax=Odynerus spinipes TaxID=1348599 RepID=A0AAD9RKJ1_9HYME|nr:hypothetical protein KPH14_005140 [Odynerus spinipes]